MRFAFIVGSLAIALTGFIILLVVHDNKHLQYAALFLAASGNFTAMPIIVCWTNTNRKAPSNCSRATGSCWSPQSEDTIDVQWLLLSRSALQVVREPPSPGTLRDSHLIWVVGGIISAFSFLAKDAPRYLPGYSVTVVFVGISLLSSTIYYVGISRENRRRDGAQTRDNSGLSEDEKKRMGDLSPDYRYLT